MVMMWAVYWVSRKDFHLAGRLVVMKVDCSVFWMVDLLVVSRDWKKAVWWGSLSVFSMVVKLEWKLAVV